MIAPLFLDTHDIRQATSFEARTGPLVAGMSSGISSTLDLSVSKEQVRHYSYWNYVAIKRILDRLSEPMPNIGHQVRRSPGERQRVTGGRRRYLQAWYGGRYIQSNDHDLEPVSPNHPLVNLLSRVNPVDTWGEFVYELGLFALLTGRFYVWVIANGFGLPSELWVIPTPWVDPKYNNSGILTHYEIIPDGDRSRQKDLLPHEVIEGRFKSPVSKIDGWSGLHAAAQWVDNAESIEKSRWHAFRNGINPDLVLMFGESYKNPDKDRLDRIKAKFLQRASGVKRAGEPLTLPFDVKAEKWSHSPKEMDYGSSSTQVRDAILALWGVPAVIAGISSDYTRATAEAAAVSFCENTLNPLFRHLAGFLTEKLAPRYDPRIVLWYDDCTPTSAEFVLERDRFHFESGARTVDELRIEAGYEPFEIPESQTGYIAVGRTPLDGTLVEDEVEEPVKPPEDEGDDDEVDEE